MSPTSTRRFLELFTARMLLRGAYEAFQRGEITHSGALVHRMVKDIDRGEPIEVFEEKLHRWSMKLSYRPPKKFWTKSNLYRSVFCPSFFELKLFISGCGTLSPVGLVTSLASRLAMNYAFPSRGTPCIDVTSKIRLIRGLKWRRKGHREVRGRPIGGPRPSA